VSQLQTQFATKRQLLQTNAELDSWHSSQDPPNPCLSGKAVLTPIVVTKLERIEKVRDSNIFNFLIVAC